MSSFAIGLLAVLRQLSPTLNSHHGHFFHSSSKMRVRRKSASCFFCSSIYCVVVSHASIE